MRHFFLLFSVMLALLSSFSNPGYAATESISGVDRIVAVVNDDVILESELNQRIRSISAQLRQRGTPLPEPKVLKRQVLDRMIITALQLQVAARTGIRVTDNTLNQAVNNVAERNGLSLAQFRQTLENDGFSFATFREDMRNQLIISQLRQRQVNNRVRVSEQEIENFLAVNKKQLDANKEYHLSHILVSLPEAASPEQIQTALARATDIRKQLLAGADFATVAASESDGQKAFEGGDLGWLKAAQLPTVFTDPIKKMSKGDISEPIRSPSGFHLIKITDVRGELKSIITETKARHILIRTNQVTSDQQAKTRLEQLRTRIIGGEDFGKLAKANSDDRGSAIHNGELGWTKPGQLVPEFENTMNKLKVNEVSEPFRTQFGWHIVQVEGRRQIDNTHDFTMNKARLLIQQRKVKEEGEAWLRRIRDEAYVEYRLQDNL